jgi:hypothetical protein
MRVEDGRNAALSPRGGGVVKFTFRHKRDPHSVGESKRERLAGEPAADDYGIKLRHCDITP